MFFYICACLGVNCGAIIFIAFPVIPAGLTINELLRNIALWDCSYSCKGEVVGCLITDQVFGHNDYQLNIIFAIWLLLTV